MTMKTIFKYIEKKQEGDQKGTLEKKNQERKQ